MSFDWGKFLGDVGKLAVAGGAIYVGYKVIEQEVDKLLMMSPEDAGAHIIAVVPKMNDDAWNAFRSVLVMKARTSDYAQALLSLASYVRNAMENIAQLLVEQPIGEAADILAGMLYRQEPWARYVYAQVLSLYGNTSGMAAMKAQAVYGRLAATNILPG